MQMAVAILVVLLVILYILSIVWVARDSRLRGENSIIWLIIALVPGAGIIAYLLLRPPMLAMDRDEQEMEVALKQRQLMKYGECANCGYPVREDYIVCPNCQTRLRNVCRRCGKPIEPNWSVCPFCATPADSGSQSSSQASNSPRRLRDQAQNQTTL